MIEFNWKHGVLCAVLGVSVLWRTMRFSSSQKPTLLPEKQSVKPPVRTQFATQKPPLLPDQTPIWKTKSWIANDLAFAPDGQTLVAAAASTIKHWDAQTGEEAKPISFPSNINTTSMSPEGDLVISSGGGGTAKQMMVQLHDTRSGKLVRQWPMVSTAKNPMTYARVMLSPANRYAVVTQVFTQSTPKNLWVGDCPHYQENLNVQVYEVASGKLIKSFKFAGTNLPSNEMNGELVFTPDSKKLMKFGADCRLHDLLSGQIIALDIPTAARKTKFWWRERAFSPDKTLFAAVGGSLSERDSQTLESPLSSTSAFYVWDVASRRLLWTQKIPARCAVFTMKFSPDSQRLAAAGTDISFRHPTIGRRSWLVVLDAQGKITHHFTEETKDDLAAYREREKLPNDLPRPTTTRRNHLNDRPSIAREPGQTNGIAWSPDGKTLAAGYAYGELKLWRVR